MAKAATAKKPELAQREKPAATDAESTKGMCKVYDKGANELDQKTGKTKLRVHTIEGKRYALSAYEDEPCYVPMEHAIFFLKDRQFAVYSPDGTRMLPQVATSDGRGIKLQKNEVIATLAELEKSSLVRRAQALPNGLTMNMNTSREALIGFIMAGGKQHTNVEDTDAKPTKAGAKGVTAEMDDDGDPEYADKLLAQQAPGTRNMPESDGDGDLEDLG